MGHILHLITKNLTYLKLNNQNFDLKAKNFTDFKLNNQNFDFKSEKWDKF